MRFKHKFINAMMGLIGLFGVLPYMKIEIIKNYTSKDYSIKENHFLNDISIFINPLNEDCTNDPLCRPPYPE